jgi:glycosyltransferase involved in cell wall biosynthesis
VVGRLTGRPVVYHSHNIMAAELPGYFEQAWSRRLAGWLARMLDNQLPRRADACIALSSEAIPFFQASGVREARLRLIPPGIDFDDAPACEIARVRQEYGLGDGPLVIYTGNLDQYQRVDSLVRSFGAVRAARPDTQLIIASHSPPQQYGRVIQRVGDCPGVRFIHCRTFDEARTLLLAADVAICPRMACFGFPMKLLNYMAAGKPVVVAQGAAKGIRHLENGYVVPDEEGALAAGVLHLLRDPDLARRLGVAARAAIAGRFQWAHAVREIERCYDDLTGCVPAPVRADGRLGSRS